MILLMVQLVDDVIPVARMPTWAWRARIDQPAINRLSF